MNDERASRESSKLSETGGLQCSSYRFLRGRGALDRRNIALHVRLRPPHAAVCESSDLFQKFVIETRTSASDPLCSGAKHAMALFLLLLLFCCCCCCCCVRARPLLARSRVLLTHELLIRSVAFTSIFSRFHTVSVKYGLCSTESVVEEEHESSTRVKVQIL